MPKIYGSSEIWGDLLVTGSFSILGSASTINTTNLVVSDTIIALGHSQSGSPSLDEGIMFVRGTGATQAFIWDESDDTFAIVETNSDHTVVGNISINSYSNLRVGGLTTSTLKMTNGASNGYFLKSNASGDSSWSQITASDVSGLPGGLTGSGTTNYLSKWTGSGTLGNSLIYDNGTVLGINGWSSQNTFGIYTSSELNSLLISNSSTNQSTKRGIQIGVDTKGISTNNFGAYIQVQDASVSNFGIYTQVSGASGSINYGSYQSVSGASNKNYGDYTQISATSGLTNYGSYQSVSGASITNYGSYIQISGTYGNLYGINIDLPETSTIKNRYGLSIGIGTSLSVGAGSDVGILSVISTTSSQSYGIYSNNYGVNTSIKYGISSVVSGASPINYGIYTSTSQANSQNYGIYNLVSGTSSQSWGSYTQVSGASSQNYGSYIQISGTYGTTNRGFYSLISSTGQSSIYSMHSSVQTSGTTYAYGLYSQLYGGTTLNVAVFGGIGSSFATTTADIAGRFIITSEIGTTYTAKSTSSGITVDNDSYSTSTKNGITINLSGGSASTLYGISNLVNNNTISTTAYANYNQVFGTAGTSYANYNNLNGSSSIWAGYGLFNNITGYSTSYGVYNQLTGATYGSTKYGVYTSITGTGSNYGEYIVISATGPSNYGLYIDSYNATTNNYGIVVNRGTSIFNEQGDDFDFRVEGDTDQNLLFVDASTDNIGIGNNTPSYKLQVSGTVSTTGFRMTNSASNGYVMMSNSDGVGSWTASYGTALFSHSSFSPADATTYYMGDLVDLTPAASDLITRRIKSQFRGEIVSVSIMCAIGGVNGTSENVTYQIGNSTTATTQTITTTAQLTGDFLTTYTLSTPLTVSVDDEISIRMVCPTWVTNPTTVRHRFTAKIRIY